MKEIKNLKINLFTKFPLKLSVNYSTTTSAEREREVSSSMSLCVNERDMCKYVRSIRVLSMNDSRCLLLLLPPPCERYFRNPRVRCQPQEFVTSRTSAFFPSVKPFNAIENL